MLFKKVENPETRAVREEIFQAFGMELTEGLILDRDTRNEALEHAFRRVRDGSKLGKCVRMLANDYIETKHCHHDVASVEFMPFGREGQGFHLKVMLRPRPRQSNEGRRR